jgi:hypothetical protein
MSAGAIMTDGHPALAYCKRDLEAYRRLLADFKSGRRKSGESTDGRTWTDKTAEQVAFLEEKINELTAILGPAADK